MFESFQQQLRQSAELEVTRERLRTILRHPAVPKALNRPQQLELRWLALRLVRESQAVLQARARSERDVRGFMKTGLAAEHHRVGQLLNDFFSLALSVDWQRQSERRKSACLPPVGVAITGVPAIERLRFKTLDDDDAGALNLSLKPAGLEQIDDDFWDAFDGLDREALIHDTLAVLVEQGRPLSLGELASLLPPAHDLETFALWLAMAREAGIEVLTEEALPEKLKRFLEYLNRSSDDGVTQLLSYIDHEVSMIEERLDDLNSTMQRVDFQPGRYLRLVAKKVIHESLRTLQQAQRQLNSARFIDDEGESHYKALQALVGLLKDACEHSRNQGAKALLDPRFRLEFAVSVIDRESRNVIETRTGSQGGSGGEKEIIASYVLTASLSYALCPDGSSRPLFGTIVLDEAFSRSSHAVAGRIIAALREFGLHAVFITPNKEMRLLRHHTRSAVVVHRRGVESSLISLSWEALDEHHQQRIKAMHEVAH